MFMKFMSNNLFFSGIGGSGMSGIAEVCHNMGFKVMGSDISDNNSVKTLKSLGIKVFLGHDKNNVSNSDVLIFSSAIKSDNPEIVEAKKQGIPVISRAEMLAELMRMKFAICVGGTHGKTSTTSMIASIFDEAQKDPTYIVGGKLHSGLSGAKLGSSDYLIAEADESDGSFLRLFPTISVINNIDDDHLDYYKSMDNLINAFKNYGESIPFYGTIVINGDCENCKKIKFNKQVLYFGINNKEADIKADILEDTMFGSIFKVIFKGESLGEIKLNIGGKHNIYNALAAIGASLSAGIDFNEIKQGLAKFYLPERRFQVLFKSSSLLIVDDYAHHPNEVEATLNMVDKTTFERKVVIFQAHRYSRLKKLMLPFAKVLSKADILFLAPLYTANQSVIKDVNTKVLAKEIKNFKSSLEVFVSDSFDDLEKKLKNELCTKDILLFLSAGDLSKFAHKFAQKFKGGLL